MSNELQDNLDAIKLDLMTNLLPVNIKEGIIVLGVTGELEDFSELLQKSY